MLSEGGDSMRKVYELIGVMTVSTALTGCAVGGAGYYDGWGGASYSGYVQSSHYFIVDDSHYYHPSRNRYYYGGGYNRHHYNHYNHYRPRPPSGHYRPDNRPPNYQRPDNRPPGGNRPDNRPPSSRPIANKPRPPSSLRPPGNNAGSGLRFNGPSLNNSRNAR